MRGTGIGWISSMNSLVKNVAKAYREVYGDREFIPLHEPSFRGNEVRYCQECIETGWVSSVGMPARASPEATPGAPLAELEAVPNDFEFDQSLSQAWDVGA